MYPHQTERLTRVLEREGLEALVATSPENIAYVTGFRSLSQAIYRRTPLFGIFSRESTALVVPLIDIPAVASAELDVAHVVAYGEFHVEHAEGRADLERRVREWSAKPAPSAADALAEGLETLGVRRGPIGLDDSSLAYDAWHRASERLRPLTVVAAGTSFAEARTIKGPYELECLERALHGVEEAANVVIQMLSPGVTETEAARAYEKAIADRGGTPYATIIAIGDRSAIPAPYPSDRALRMRDLVRLEVSAAFKGYCATLARTAVMGEPNDRQDHAFRAIQVGLEAALDAVNPGVSAGRVFEVAVDATRKNGLAEYRRHHVGHGIGLEPYEPPLLAAGDDTEIEAGMVLRIETPYYQAGWGGLTAMDTLWVTRGGARVLNRAARGLVVLD
jgi:Xaa-Pro dipeptidase